MLPLAGYKVVDITRLLPGGFCSYLLSAYGAEVIKVEEPGLGDYMRYTPPLLDGVSLVHTMVNRGKRSIGLDLKKREGKNVLKRLIERSDVFLEGFRPGVVDRLGFSFEEVKKLNDKVVYCSISSFGCRSPLSSMPAHDLNFEAMSGFLGSSGRPRVPFVQVGDYTSAMYATMGILSSLLRRPRSAAFIDVPIVQSLISLLMLPAADYFTTRKPPSRGGSLVFGSEPYYSTYRTSDSRYLAVAAIEPHLWRNLTRALGLSRISRLRDGTRADRTRLRREMERVFASRTQEEWSRKLMKEDTCVTPVLDIHEALDSVWAREGGVIGEVAGRPVVNQPLDLGSTAPAGDAPSLGEHTRVILQELGYRPSAVRSLLRSRAVA